MHMGLMDVKISNRKFFCLENFRVKVFKAENFGGRSTWCSHEYQSENRDGRNGKFID